MHQLASLKKLFLLLLANIALALLMIFLYAPSYTGNFYLDSKPYIGESHFFRGGISTKEGLARVLERGYHPASRRILPNITVALQTHEKGPKPSSLRRINAVIHSVNICILFLVSFSFLRIIYPELKSSTLFPVSVLSSLLWGLNPYQVETVAYVVQRSVLMETGFFLLATLLFLYIPKKSSTKKKFFYWSAFILVSAAAVLSKENAILLPITLGFIYLYLDATEDRRRNISNLLLLGLSGIIMLIVMLSARGMDASPLSGFTNRSYTPLARLLTEFRVILHQLFTFMLPVPGNLTLTPNYTISRGLLHPPTTLFSILIIISVILLIYRLRGKTTLPGIAVIWYLSGHLVESTILPLEIAFPHRNYLPTCLIYLPIVSALFLYIFSKRPRANYVFVSAGIVILIIFAAGTYSRANLWGNEIRFWKNNIAASPGAPLPYLSLSGYLLERRKPKEALLVIDRALDKANLQDDLPRRKASLYVNKGLALSQLGDLNEGLGWVGKGLEISPSDLNFQYNSGILHSRANRKEEARNIFQNIISSDPTYPDAHLQLALIYESMGRNDSALQLIRREVRLFPDNRYARVVLSRLQGKMR